MGSEPDYPPAAGLNAGDLPGDGALEFDRADREGTVELKRGRIRVNLEGQRRCWVCSDICFMIDSGRVVGVQLVWEFVDLSVMPREHILAELVGGRLGKVGRCPR